MSFLNVYGDLATFNEMSTSILKVIPRTMKALLPDKKTG